MCFCTPGIKTPYCDSFKCQQERDRLEKEEDIVFKDKTAQIKARMQLMWVWIETISTATDIKPPSEFYKWFDSYGKPV